MGSFSWLFEAVPLGSGLLSSTLEILGPPVSLEFFTGSLLSVHKVEKGEREERGGEQRAGEERGGIL